MNSRTSLKKVQEECRIRHAKKCGCIACCGCAAYVVVAKGRLGRCLLRLATPGRWDLNALDKVRK